MWRHWVTELYFISWTRVFSDFIDDKRLLNWNPDKTYVPFHSKTFCLPLWSELQSSLRPGMCSNLLWESSPSRTKSTNSASRRPDEACSASDLRHCWTSRITGTSRNDGRSRAPRGRRSSGTPGASRTTRAACTPWSPKPMLCRATSSRKVKNETNYHEIHVQKLRINAALFNTTKKRCIHVEINFYFITIS